MEKLQLQAQVRDLSIPAEKVRSQGFIPAELYGHNIENIHIQVSRGDFEKLFRKAGESTIIELSIEGKGVHNVLVQEVQRHYLNNFVIHVDFMEVSMTEKLTTQVALEFVGESPAVKAMSGTLVKVLDVVEIECLPTDLPHNLEVDIAKLVTFEDVIIVADIALPKGVTMITTGEDVVAKVQPPRDLEAELSAPVVEDVTTVGQVEKKKESEEVAAE